MVPVGTGTQTPPSIIISDLGVVCVQCLDVCRGDAMTVYPVTTILLVAALLALSCAQDRTVHVQIDIEHALLTGSVLDPKDIQWSPRGTVSADLVRRGGQLELSAASMSNEVMSTSFRKELEV